VEPVIRRGPQPNKREKEFGDSGDKKGFQGSEYIFSDPLNPLPIPEIPNLWILVFWTDRGKK
jgi:hypothetical protein